MWLGIQKFSNKGCRFGTARGSGCFPFAIALGWMVNLR
jgi:hypothetical protein